jgi:hypothetical protein
MFYQGTGGALYRIALTAKKDTGALLGSGERDSSDAAMEDASAVAGFHLDGAVERHLVVDLKDVAIVAEASEEAADGLAGEAGHAAEIFVGKFHEEGDGEIGMGWGAVELVHTGEVEEGAGELAGGGGVKSEATRSEDGAVVLACEGQSGDAADIGVGFHEPDEFAAGNGFDGAGGEGFRGDAIEAVLVQSGEAEDIAGAGDAEEKEAAFGGGGGKFDAAAADDQKMVGGKAFAEECFVGIVVSANSDGVEVAQGDAGEGTKTL